MIIKVKVKPNSKKEEINKVSENEFVIYVGEEAENNKANIRVVNLLAKEFDVSFRDIKIINKRSKDKLIEIKENSDN